MAFSPDGQSIVSGSSDKNIRVWPINTNQIAIPQSFNNDLAEGNDSLSIKEELDALTQVLMLRLLKPPLAVALLGSWGSGKSFAMHLMQTHINSIRTQALAQVEAWGSSPNVQFPYTGHIYQIKFDAWSYAKENLWASLMQEIFFELNRQISWEQQLGEFLVENQGSDQLKNNNNRARSKKRVKQKWFWLRIKVPGIKELSRFRKTYRVWQQKQIQKNNSEQTPRLFDIWVYQPLKRWVYPWFYYESTLLKKLDLNVYQPLIHIIIIGIVIVVVAAFSLPLKIISIFRNTYFSIYDNADAVCDALSKFKIGEYDKFDQYYIPRNLWIEENPWIENVIEHILFLFFVGFFKRRKDRAQQWDSEPDALDDSNSDNATSQPTEKSQRDLEQYAQILRKGGNIWTSIYMTDEGKRTQFLIQELKKLDTTKNLDRNQLKNLKDPNYLWNTLSHIRQQERQQLKKAEASLQAKERELQRSLKKIEIDVDQQLSRQKIAAIWKPFLNTLLRQRYSEEQIEAFTTKGKTLSKIPAAFQSLSGFICLFLLGFGFIYLRQPDQFPFLPSPSDILQFLQSAWQTLQSWLVQTGLPAAVQPWIAALIPILPILWKYIKAVQKEQARIQSERDILLEQKRSSTNIIAEEVAKLKLQVNEQRQRIGITAEHPSLLDFVNARLDNEAYGQHLGLMKQIQQDLSDLTQQLTPGPHNAKALKNLFPRGPARVVVYIDDLDRCPPDRVVQVLEAVQLLLKTKLFIVVLAIDDRYIARALEEVYQGVLKRGGVPSGVDYLEKIIQIPYRMRPISPKNVESYLSSQVQVKRAEQATKSETKAIEPGDETNPEQLQPKKEEREPNKAKTQVTVPSRETAPKRTQIQISEQPPVQLKSKETAPTKEVEPKQVTPPESPSEKSTEADLQELEAAQSQEQQPAPSSPDQPIPVQQTNRQPVERTPQSPRSAPPQQPTPSQQPEQPQPGQSMGNVIAVTEFDQAEFNLLVECCNHVDITPRTGKRLTNIYKVLKVIWAKRGKPTAESKKVVLVLLALSGRYPNLMRDVFKELDARFDEQVSSQELNPLLGIEWEEFRKKLNRPTKADFHAHRERRRFESDIKRLLKDSFEIDRDTFHLALSFCFVGDIGYDPTDTAITENPPSIRDLTLLQKTQKGQSINKQAEEDIIK